MFEALYVGATGMQAQQLNVDTIANNLVNANTAGYKKGRVSFTELVTMGASRTAPTTGAEPDLLAERLRSGAGVGITSMAKVFDAGDLRKTESPFDVAIQGDGFLEVTTVDGTRTFMRGGTLKVSKEGLLANAAGEPLKPSITIPDNINTFTITKDGKVWTQAGNQTLPVEVGQLDLVRFMNPGGLVPLGEGMYRSSVASGEALSLRAGEDGAGTFAQGFLEGSNVRMVDEMVGLMLAQRAYEASMKVVQASDEMLGLVNGLRK